MFEYEPPEQFGGVSFNLTDNSRTVQFSTTLSGEDIKAHVEAFRYALKAFGFCNSSIDRYVPPLED